MDRGIDAASRRQEEREPLDTGKVWWSQIQARAVDVGT
jgi:hypothetical protein